MASNNLIAVPQSGSYTTADTINNMSPFTYGGPTQAQLPYTTVDTINNMSPLTQYSPTYNPNTPGASASPLQAPTTQDILDQLAGKVSSGTINELADYGAQRGAGGGFGVDSPNSNASVMRALGLTSEGLVQQGIGNSQSQQGIDNQMSQYNTSLQNTKDQFAAQLGLSYDQLNEKQKEFVDSQAQQAFQFQQNMQLQWAALNKQHAASGGGGSGGGQQPGATQGTGTTNQQTFPQPGTIPGQTDQSTDWMGDYINPDTGIMYDDSGGDQGSSVNTGWDMGQDFSSYA